MQNCIDGDGGAIFSETSFEEFYEDTVFIGNSAKNRFGGSGFCGDLAYLDGAYYTFDMTDVTMINNTGLVGGSWYLLDVVCYVCFFF